MTGTAAGTEQTGSVAEKKRLYLHIGSHKTGTTTLQYALAHSGHALQRAGYIYPDVARFYYGHHRLGFGFVGRIDKDRNDRPDPEREGPALRDAIADSPCSSAIISSEVLFLVSDAAIARIADWFAAFDVKVVAYIRRPDRLFESVYNQKAKLPHGSFCSPYRDFLENPERLAPDIAFAKILARWEQVFGRQAMIVRPYETSDPVGDFTAACQLPEGTLAKHQDRNLNRGISLPALEIMRLAKVSRQDKDTIERLFELAKVHFPLSGKDALLEPQERLDLITRYEQASMEVFARYIGEPCPYTAAQAKAQGLLEPERLTPQMHNDFLCRIVAEYGAAADRNSRFGAGGPSLVARLRALASRVLSGNARKR